MTLREKPTFKNFDLNLATSDWKYDAIVLVLGTSSLIGYLLYRNDTLRISGLDT